MAEFEANDEITLQQALTDAAGSNDVYNFINIDTSHITIGSPLVLDNSFDADRQLTIRPNPEIHNLPRATIASIDLDPGQPVVSAGDAGYVTFQDLDIVRNITNRGDIVRLDYCNDITIERCRIGSIWPSTGEDGKSNLHIFRPIRVLVRNSILFAHHPSTFAYGIWAQLVKGDTNSLLLYNNVIADYGLDGTYVIEDGNDTLLVMRNNVAVNHSSVDPEPFAYHSNVDNSAAVLTSHNVAFASRWHVEQIDGDQSIGELGVGFLRHARALVENAFVQHTWVINPEWDLNVDFFRLVPDGPLHSRSADAGTNVLEPDLDDMLVTDDIWMSPRPAGWPLHTDRGVVQILEDDTLLDLGSFRLTPSDVAGCRGCIGKITLNGIAPEGGWQVKIASTNPAAAVPASILVPTGAASQTFQITTMPVKTVQVGKVTATCRGVTRSRSLTVHPIGVDALSFSFTTVIGGKNVIGTVALECAAAPGSITVTLKSSSASAIVPSSFTVLKGRPSGTFRVKTQSVSARKSVTITATANGISKSATLKIKPD